MKGDKKGPCFECKDRYPCCTDTCEKHREYFTQQRKIMDKIKYDHMVDSVMFEGRERCGHVKNSKIKRRK